MRAFSAPVRFLAGVVMLWAGARIWWLLPEHVQREVVPPAQAGTEPALPKVTPATAAAAPWRQARPPSPMHEQTASPHHITLAMAKEPRPAAVPAPVALDTGSPGPRPHASVSIDLPPSPSRPQPGASVSRWSGNAYLFVRNGGSDALAAGGQLGGGQIGARIAWRLNRDGPTKAALAARAYAPLDNHRGSELAVGLDLHPLPRRPLRLSIERRFDAGGEGRSAWSAYAAGGFWRPIGNGVELDGYAQAGLVGVRSHDLFADGALRIARRMDIGRDTALRIGGGAWAGAQPGVERLDIGPRLAAGFTLGNANLSAAVEGRFRIAGDAAPGSGVALTLATDF